MHTEAGALRDVLAQQSIGVLVRAVLPGSVGITEAARPRHAQRKSINGWRVTRPTVSTSCARTPSQQPTRRGHWSLDLQARSLSPQCLILLNKRLEMMLLYRYCYACLWDQDGAGMEDVHGTTAPEDSAG